MHRRSCAWGAEIHHFQKIPKYFLKKTVFEHKFRSRLKVYGPFQTYRCVIKCWFLDIGASDVHPEGGERWAMVGKAVRISFPSSLSLIEIKSCYFILCLLKSAETVRGDVHQNSLAITV